MSAPALEPLAVYDVNDGSYVHGDHCRPFNAWVVEHGISLHDTFRIEIHLLDCPFARVFQYDKDENGRVHGDLVTGETALRAPFDLPVSSMPPVEPVR